MSLEYYIFCKEQYEGIILRLENIIENYNFNIDATNSEENIDKKQVIYVSQSCNKPTQN